MKTSIIKSVILSIVGFLWMFVPVNVQAQRKVQKPVYVLVHGAWHGGWCWQQVSEKLRKQGALVYTPTLSGLAERKNELDSTVNLSTHIHDIIDLITKEDLHNVILVGHSYGGEVIAGVADSIPGRLKKLVYLDALLVENGQSTLSVNTKENMELFSKTAMEFDKGLSIPSPSSTWFGVKDSIAIKWADARLTNQPFRTFTQPVSLKHVYGNNLPQIYIACRNPELAVLEQFATKAKNDKTWKYYELNTGHDAMITMPVELTALLSSFK